MDNDSSSSPDKHRWIVAGLCALGGIDVICMFLFALQSPISGFAGRLSVSLVSTSAALVIGGLLGFLFGIPKTLQKDASDEGQPSKSAVGYRPNTNLEQISDWLTKILVGIGLTQIRTIRDGLLVVGKGMAAALGNSPLSLAYSLGTILYGVVLGFIVGFLATRLLLAGMMKRADVGVLEAKLDEFTKRAEADRRALALAWRQLNPSGETADIKQSELDQAFAEASDPVRAQIFFQSQGIRSNNWREPNRKPIMERTIPIFRALINCDTENKFHENHAQLGFALKDQRNPSWSEAENELTQAIRMRGPNPLDRFFRRYEVARAMCVIGQDPHFANRQPSDPQLRDRVLEDLRLGCSVDYLAEIVERDSTVMEWAEINRLTLDDLLHPAAQQKRKEGKRGTPAHHHAAA